MNEFFPSLSKTKVTILMLLRADIELFGLEMVKMSEGRLKRGTVYVVLQRMEKDGLISGRNEERKPPEIGIPRRIYRLTDTGKRIVKALAAAQKVMSR